MTQKILQFLIVPVHFPVTFSTCCVCHVLSRVSRQAHYQVTCFSTCFFEARYACLLHYWHLYLTVWRAYTGASDSVKKKKGGNSSSRCVSNTIHHVLNLTSLLSYLIFFHIFIFNLIPHFSFLQSQSDNDNWPVRQQDVKKKGKKKKRLRLYRYR